VLAPERALRARLYRGVRQILVQWQGAPPSSASWEDLADFQQRYPTFQLEDELLHEGGGGGGGRYHGGQSLRTPPQEDSGGRLGLCHRPWLLFGRLSPRY